MCVVLVPNIGISTSISNTTQIRPQHLINYVCPLGMCVVLVPNIGFSTSIFQTAQKRLQYFRQYMCVNWECAWCYYQIFLLAPAYPTLHKYAQSTSENSCVSTGNVRGASAKYWYQHQHIQYYTNTPTDLLRNLICVHWEYAWCQCLRLVLAPAYPTLHTYARSTSETSCVSNGNMRGVSSNILVLAPAYPTLHKYAHSTSGTSSVSTWNMRGASAKYFSQHQHIQHYTNILTAIQKLHVCLLEIWVVLVLNIGISTSISNTKKIRPQYL